MNSRRMNRLEELGRVNAEKAKTKMGARNLRDEKSRIIRELKADGGSTGSKYITKKKTPYITKKSDSSSSGSSWIKKKIKKPQYITKKEKTGPYITKKKKYITKKSPDQIQDSERMRRSYGGITKGVKEDSMRDRKKQPLKKVKPNQKGLKKLPTKVRNKMGYMKKGGRVGMGKAMRGGGCVR